MAWTTPRTWVANELVTAAQMNTHVRDNLASLTSATVRAYHNSTQNILSGTATTLSFNSERFDLLGGAASTQHDNAVNNSRLTCQLAGVYLITATIALTSGTGGTYRRLQLAYNGGTYIAVSMVVPTSGGFSQMNITTLYNLSLTDYVEVVVDQDSGSTMTTAVVGNESPEFAMARVA